ncbi:MAG: hypothetical protein RIR00_1971 [Pseudomonadota bacterium]
MFFCNKRQRRKEARPSELTTAALALFVEKGFAATRLDDIAARAGVSKGTLYLYFDSKEALFKAVIQEGLVPRLAEAQALAERHQGSAGELLQLLLEAWWQDIGETPLAGIPKLMVAEARNFPEVAAYYHEKVIFAGRALLGSALQRGMASGEFRTLNIDQCIDLTIAPLLMMVIWRHSLAPCGMAMGEPRELLRTHLDLLLHGLQSPENRQ